jgi:cytochrome c2
MTLVVVAIIVACAWLAVSVYIAVREAEVAMMHAEFVKCPRCHHHYFVGRGQAEHQCEPRTGRRWHVVGRPAVSASGRHFGRAE